MLHPMAQTTVFLMLLCSLTARSQKEEEHSETSFPYIRCAKATQSMGPHCYALYSTPKSWYDAERACQQWPSGHLTSVLNAAEAFYVSALVKSSLQQHHKYIWIGLHDQSQGREFRDTRWKWSSRENTYYFNWERTPSAVPNHKYCGSLTGDTEYLKWIDFHCYIKLPYVCKLKR